MLRWFLDVVGIGICGREGRGTAVLVLWRLSRSRRISGWSYRGMDCRKREKALTYSVVSVFEDGLG